MSVQPFLSVDSAVDVYNRAVDVRKDHPYIRMGQALMNELDVDARRYVIDYDPNQMWLWNQTDQKKAVEYFFMVYVDHSL